MKPELTLLHTKASHIGYGRMGVAINKALRDYGLDIYEAVDAPNLPRNFLEGEEAKQTNVVCWLSVPAHAAGWWKGQVPVILTMWEATRLPESYRETLDEFETVLVPSNQNVELFGRYHNNVKKVHLGIDPDVWNFTPRQDPGLYFDFLIGGSGARKGTDLAYKAFLKVFKTWPKEMPVPRLIMKSPKAIAEYSADRVVQVNGFIPLEAEVALYASSHVYVQPARGEGFGLQPLQAMAQGLPTILTDAHGHAPFAHLGYGLSTSMVKAGYFIAGDAGDWWEPNFDELCERMEFVYHNYDKAKQVGEMASVSVAEQFTWKHTADQFVDAVGLDKLTVPYSGSGEWFKPFQKQYPVITNVDMMCDVAGIHYRFVKGETAYAVADVKRILWESGKLDPACLDTTRDDDIGLNATQLENLAEYVNRHSYCPTCGVFLNSQKTKADEIYEELEANAAV